MTMKASVWIDTYLWFNSHHQRATVAPASFGRLVSPRTTPNKHSRSCVTMVTKYMPAWL